MWRSIFVMSAIRWHYETEKKWKLRVIILCCTWHTACMVITLPIQFLTWLSECQASRVSVCKSCMVCTTSEKQNSRTCQRRKRIFKDKVQIKKSKLFVYFFQRLSLPPLLLPLLIYNFWKFVNKFSIAHSFHWSEKWPEFPGLFKT